MFNYRETIEGREEEGAERDLGLKFRWKTVGKGFSEGRRRTRGEETKGRPAAGLLSDINSLFIAGINHSSPAANDPPGEYIGVIKGGTIPCRALGYAFSVYSIFLGRSRCLTFPINMETCSLCTGNWNRK